MMVHKGIDICCFIESEQFLLVWEVAIVVVFVLDVEALTWAMMALSIVCQYYITLCILENVTVGHNRIVRISSIKSTIIHGLAWLRN